MCHLLYTRVAHFAILTLVDLLFRTVPLFCSSDLSGFNGISVKASLINNMSNNRMLVFATSLKIHQIEWQLPTDQTKWKIKQKYKLGKMEKIRLDMGEKLCDIIDMGEKNYAFIWTEIKRPLFDDKKNFVFNCFDSNSRNALSIREKWGNSIRLIKLKNLSLKRSITVCVCVCVNYRMEYFFVIVFHLLRFVSFIMFVCMSQLTFITFSLLSFVFRMLLCICDISVPLSPPLALLTLIEPQPLPLSLLFALSKLKYTILQPETHKFFIWCFILSIPKLLLFIVLTWMH